MARGKRRAAIVAWRARQLSKRRRQRASAAAFKHFRRGALARFDMRASTAYRKRAPAPWYALASLINKRGGHIAPSLSAINAASVGGAAPHLQRAQHIATLRGIYKTQT